MRLIDADAIEWLQATGYVTVGEEEFGERTYVFIPINSLDELPTIDAVPVVRCKDCKHRPKDTGANHDLDFPDHVCPCQCEDDYWYSWKPDDDWFCADGERREE